MSYVYTKVKSEQTFRGQLISCHFVEGSFVKLDANSLAVVAIDFSCTVQFARTAGIPNKVHSKAHPRDISGTWYRPINGKALST